MSFYEQWERLDPPGFGDEVDHSRFVGYMNRKDFLPNLQKELGNPQVLVEITSKCNFFCSYCQSATSIRPKGFMDEALFRHIADQLPQITSNPVALHIDGEPTLHPKFMAFAQYLNEKGLRVALASNGTTLQESYHSLKMSVTIYVSSTPEEFATRSNLDFERHNQKLAKYISEWAKNDSDQSITLNVYATQHEISQPDVMRRKVDFAADFLRSAGIPVSTLEYGSVVFFTFRKSNGNKLVFRTAPLVSGGLFPDSDDDSPHHQHKDRSFGFCDSAWRRLVIYCDGTIGLCCHALQGETIYTRPEEIRTTPLKDLWLNHAYAQLFRKGMAHGKILLDSCKDCLDRYPNREFYTRISHYVPDVTLARNESVTCEPGGKGGSMLLTGFAQNINNGLRWTNGTTAKFGFHLEDLTPRQGLEINFMGFAPQELGDDQFVDVIANGQKAGRVQLRHMTMSKATILMPESSDEEGGIEIVLRFSPRKSPHELGISGDRRKLGIGIAEMKIVDMPANIEILDPGAGLHSSEPIESGDEEGKAHEADYLPKLASAGAS